MSVIAQFLGALAVAAQSWGCACEGDARIDERDDVLREETLVNCRCAVNFDSLAQQFGGAPAELILDVPSCLPPELNVHIADPATAEALRDLSEADYNARIGEFCNTQVKDTVTAAIGFLNGGACGHFTIANCNPVGPDGSSKASTRNSACEVPCASVPCDSTTCNPDEVAPTVSTIDVSKCACTDLNGCGTSVSLCAPPQVFTPTAPSIEGDGFAALLAEPSASGLLSRLVVPTTRIDINPAYSDAFVDVEFCKTIVFEFCTSDSASALVDGTVNLLGRPCPGASCTMGLEAWLTASNIDLEFDVAVIEVGSAHISNVSLTARTTADGVQVAADGQAVIAAGALQIEATGVRDGNKLVTFRDTNAAPISFALDYAAGTFTLRDFTLPFAEGHATLDLTGSFAARAVTTSAGADQTLECQAPEGAVATLNASTTDTSSALYSWWRGDALDTANQLNPGQFSNASIQTLAPIGTTQYAVSVVADGLAVASDETSVSVQDTTPPMLHVDDVIVECSASNGQAVPLPSPNVADVCDTTPVVNVDAPATFPLGDTPVTWHATDDAGNTSQFVSFVRVQDTTPPSLTLQVTPNTIWSPDGKFVPVHVNASVSDVCDASAAVKLVSVTATEPGVSTPVPADDIRGASLGTADFDIELRGRRRGQAQLGRIYRLLYEAKDASNNTTQVSVQVTVPHSAP